jgi:ATP-binding cassette subfamily A (ABC1) protein 3
MTPVEHLRIFALVKGLKGHKVEEAMEYFMRIMQLDAFRKTKAGNLSGGNKRKLCVAIALIGSPSMQFFDEPSSGVDPIARRFLWNTINQGLRINSSAVVLTTHSMDEAESLCHKIGIQINGQFVCMGSPQHLKSKYGQGYQITLEAIGDRH